jgi:hypothetical protein
MTNARPAVFLLFVSLLQACGSGGGDGGGGGSGPVPHLAVSPTNVSVTATPGDMSPPGAVTLTVTDPPNDGLFLSAAHTSSGIESLSVFPVNATQVNLNIAFRSPGSLQNDTYTDSITLRVCPDDQCASQIQGSPVNVATSYVISGTGTARATINRELIHYTADEGEPNSRSEQVRVILNEAPASGTQIQVTQSANAIQTVDTSRLSTTETTFTIVFNPTAVLGQGVFNDTVTINFCYDLTCVRQVEGSPFTVATTVTVGVGPEFGYDPLLVESRTALAHDVIDAEFSQALNQVVMVGSQPVNALYVYDVATGVERQQLLGSVPAALSLAPDGLSAAVAHDALISVVDLATVGQLGAPSPLLLDVSENVFDLVLDGLGSVHAMPRFGTWVQPHSIDIATNTEQLGTYPLSSGSHARLHPAGGFIYTVGDAAVASGNIVKWDISSGVATSLYESPYLGEHEMCGELWFDESGAKIYSACGNTFDSSDVQAQDIIYAGSIVLSPPETFSRFLIGHLSQSNARHEIALVEYHEHDCSNFGAQGPCYTHLAYYDSTSLNRQAVFSIPPVTVSDTDYRQRGLFVFHDPVNGRKYLLSRLENMTNPDAEYYLSVIP